MATIAFIGLGVMGAPIAGHLATAGHDVRVYNRTPSKASTWLKQYSGTQLNTPAKAAQGADVLITCVGNDDDLRSVVYQQSGSLTRGIKPGAVLIDHSTTSAEVTHEISKQLKDYGASFIDAPVSGGQSGAESGQLTIMCGGAEQVFNGVRPILDTYAKRVMLMGPVGSGQKTKMVNQICVAGLIQALAEGVSFAQKAGLDVEKVFSVISQGAAQSWQMDNRAMTMHENEYDFGFAVDWMRKDLAICLQEAEKNGAKLPVTRLVDQFYSEIQTLYNGGRLDTSSLLKRLQD